MVPSDILIEGVRIHDVQSYNLVQCHIEGLAIFAGRHITVADSRFWGNSVYDVFVQANSGPISGIAFRGNWMAMPVGVDGVENGTVIGFSAITSNVLVEDNRFNYIISLDDDGLNPVYSNFKLVGNVGMLPYAGCTLRGITWTHNVLEEWRLLGQRHRPARRRVALSRPGQHRGARLLADAAVLRRPEVVYELFRP